MQPIYIYIKQPDSIFDIIEYLIVQDMNLENTYEFNSFQYNSGSTVIVIETSIIDLYSDPIYHYQYKTIKNCSFSLITFNELLNLIEDVNKETNYSKYKIINLLQLVVAKWDDWY